MTHPRESEFYDALLGLIADGALGPLALGGSVTTLRELIRHLCDVEATMAKVVESPGDSALASDARAALKRYDSAFQNAAVEYLEAE